MFKDVFTDEYCLIYPNTNGTTCIIGKTQNDHLYVWCLLTGNVTDTKYKAMVFYNTVDSNTTPHGQTKKSYVTWSSASKVLPFNFKTLRTFDIYYFKEPTATLMNYISSIDNPVPYNVTQSNVDVDKTHSFRIAHSRQLMMLSHQHLKMQIIVNIKYNNHTLNKLV